VIAGCTNRNLLVQQQSVGRAVRFRAAVANNLPKKRAKSGSVSKAVSKKKATKPIREAAASPNEQGKFVIGDKVTHPMFGEGTVTAIDADKLTIKFAQVIRQIVNYYVKKSR
jgi:hypothetical protein